MQMAELKENPDSFFFNGSFIYHGILYLKGQIKLVCNNYLLKLP